MGFSQPFDFDTTPTGEDIIGRKEELSFFLTSILESKKGISLYAPPHSGKKTIVYEGLTMLKKTGFRYVLCEMDLFNIRSRKAFYLLFREKLKDCLKRTENGIFPSFGMEIETVPEEKLFDAAEVIAQDSNLTLIVYFREFQNILTFEEKIPLSDLDRLWSRQKNVRYIITGSNVNAMKHIFEIKKLFYYATSNIKLTGIDKKEICQYIRKSFIDRGRIIEDDEVDKVYRITSGNIYYVKQLCYFCFNRPIGFVNGTIVKQAGDTLLTIYTPGFKQTMLDLTPNQINFIKAVIDGVQKFSSSEILEKYNLNSSANVFRIKDSLKKKEILTFERDDSARILDPLFEYWLRERYFQ